MNKWIIAIIILLIVICIVVTNGIRGYRHNYLRTMAVEMFDEFNRQDIQYWVDYGTLLGIVREKDIIRHDDDIDVCTLESPDVIYPKLRKVLKSLKQRGREYFLEYHPWGAFRIRKKGPISLWFMDIFICEERNGKYVDPTGDIPIHLVGRTQYIPWQGIYVPVPQKLHETLVHRYGPTYMTPQKDKKAISNFH